METRVLTPEGLKISTVVIKLQKKPKTLQTFHNSRDSVNKTEDEKPSSSSGHCETSDQENHGRTSCSYSSDERQHKSSNGSSSSHSVSFSSDSSDKELEPSVLNKISDSDRFVIGSSENRYVRRKLRSQGKLYVTTQVRICADRLVEKGTIFSPNEGDMQIVHLMEIPAIAKDDIRFIFGGFEKVTLSPHIHTHPAADPLISSASAGSSAKAEIFSKQKQCGNLIRLCNWVRFLHQVPSLHPYTINPLSKSESDDENVAVWDTNTADSRKTNDSGDSNGSNNIIARFIDGRPVFEVTARLVPGTELRVYFDMDSITQTAPLMMMMSIPSTREAVSSSPHYQKPYSCISSSSSSTFLDFSCHNGLASSKFHGGNLQEHHNLNLTNLHPYEFHLHQNENDSNKTNRDSRLWAKNDIQLMNYAERVGAHDKTENTREFQRRDNASLGFDGPLDLSKLPNLGIKESLKVGTPFDSPDSNDDVDDYKTISLPNVKKETSFGSGTLFSINNVLKQPAKLFQPYSLECDNGSLREISRRSVKPAHTLTTMSSLALPPPLGSTSSAVVVLNSPIIRPVLRTRGRERSLLPCEVCGKAFDRPSLLKRHLRTHTGEKPHICDVCSKGFSTSSSLNTHRRIHSGEKPHQCPICGKRFTASSNLYYHRMTHNKEKPHKCMLCGKSFPTPGDLKSHQYVHSGSWPYTCPVCHRGFSKQTNLRNHLLLHSGMGSSTSKSGDKPHTCQICDKKFALACNLRAHLRTHEEDSVSSCSLCKRTFLTSLNMLVNERCGSCVLNHQPANKNSSVHSNKLTTNPTVNIEGSSMEPSMITHRISSSVPQQTNLNSQHSNNPMQIGPLTMANFPGFTMPFPASLSLQSGLQFSAAAEAPNSLSTAGVSTSSLFRNGGATAAASQVNSVPNPFLEQLFEWNYRFAKETAGTLSLSIMQQKFLESQVLAAQLMSASANNSTFGINAIPDILRLHRTEFQQMETSNDSKYLQR